MPAPKEEQHEADEEYSYEDDLEGEESESDTTVLPNIQPQNMPAAPPAAPASLSQRPVRGRSPVRGTSARSKSCRDKDQTRSSANASCPLGADPQIRKKDRSRSRRRRNKRRSHSRRRKRDDHKEIVREEEKNTNTGLKKTSAPPEQHGAGNSDMWTVRPVESGYERHLLPQGRLQQPSWETCFSDASIAAAGLAVSMRWNNISGAASTVLRRKARANPDSMDYR
eukprot:symbB.v1.2.029627.t1/scaffold3263.1/size104115/3